MIIDQERARYQGIPENNDLVMYNAPARQKAMPPTISCFQDITRMIIRKKEGMLCISNPTIIPQKPSFMSKTSSENKERNRMNRIANTLGDQKRNLPIFFFFIKIVCWFKYIKYTL